VKLYVVVMIGGAIGSALRFGLSGWISEALQSTFPWGTLAVNVIGSLLIGLFTGLTGPDGPLFVSPATRAFVSIGIFGGFTTFSSFSLQTILLIQESQWISAFGNVAYSVLLCLMGTALGFALANALPGRI
jgi:CrcB protein